MATIKKVVMAKKAVPAAKKVVKKKAAAKDKTSTVSAPISKMEKKWEIESALSTLKRADEIRKDAKMMNDVKKFAQEQMNALRTFSK